MEVISVRLSVCDLVLVPKISRLSKIKLPGMCTSKD